MNIPTPGRIVLYTLSASDASAIYQQRVGGAPVVGNAVSPGDVFPMMITRVWAGSPSVQGQVFLDGNDTLWVTSVPEGTGERTFAWPEHA